MSYPRAFLAPKNFDLAFQRIVRGENSDYKHFYRHLFPGYQLTLADNLRVIIKSISNGTYSPSTPTIVFNPKKSGILRPLCLLTFRDLIVYQAIVNVIADKMSNIQQRYAFNKSFGAIYAGPNSKFFFSSWKKGYREFTKSVTSAFNRGNVYVADFDLVSCYELIDHNLLYSHIKNRVQNRHLLTLLSNCLAKWTTNAEGQNLRHGLPQGPECSAFLAECVLQKFDAIQFRNIRYARYVDDIRLMAKDEIPLRRALLKLDLTSKELGLVPQAQKINLGKVERLEDITKSIPSMLVAQVEKDGKESQKSLYKLFRMSIKRKNHIHEIIDVTKFRYSLIRLNPR